MKSAKDKLGQSIQKDIFFDFKKRILLSIIFIGVFLLLAIYNLFVSSPIINLLIVLIGILGAITFFLFFLKIKQVQKEYEKIGEAIFDDIDHSSSKH